MLLHKKKKKRINKLKVNLMIKIMINNKRELKMVKTKKMKTQYYQRKISRQNNIVNCKKKINYRKYKVDH